MNHHTRSYSEQPQLTPIVTAGPNTGNAQPQSYVREHSDSQQSLDQLFNPTLTSVPLRNRNLPPSFFNPSVKNDDETNNGTNGNHGAHMANNFHSRSISFDQRGLLNGRPNAMNRQNFHMRTHSTLAPMPRLDSNHSSHQSSHEFLNTPTNNNNNNTGNSNNNVSSCQQHSENVVSSTSTNNQNHHQQQQQHHHHHHNHHSTNSNGWSSAGNSVDDLSAPAWPNGQHQNQPIVQPAPMQVVHQHHHTMTSEQPTPAQPTAAVRHLQHQHQAPQQQQQQQQQQQNMFYNNTQQSQAADTTTIPVGTSHVCPNHASLHARSVSFQQQAPLSAARVNHGFHMRTHSTVAPMSSTCTHHHAASHHSSHQSSQEFLNHSNATTVSTGTAGWSSSGYSTDDMSGASGWSSGHHNHNHQHHPQHQTLQTHQHQHHPQPPSLSHLHITQQPLPAPPTIDHQPNAAPTTTAALPHHNGHHHHHLHHHHHNIPMQVPHSQQAPQQLFYNV